MGVLSDAIHSSHFSEEIDSEQVYNIGGIDVYAKRSERETAEKLISSLEKIPTGRAALEEIKKSKASIAFEDAPKTGGHFTNGNIFLSRMNQPAFSWFVLVHEARHLRQANNGADLIESQKLDAASRLMVNRAKEADAQVEALMACKEWEALGDPLPLQLYEGHSKPIVDRFNKTGDYSDAFKGWYDDTTRASSYEFLYEIKNTLLAPPKGGKEAYVSLKPADIAEFCGADRVKDFDGFLCSKQAAQVHQLTKDFLTVIDKEDVSGGYPHDASLDTLPVRDMNDPATRFNAKSVQERTQALFDGLKYYRPYVSFIENIEKSLFAQKKDTDTKADTSPKKEETETGKSKGLIANIFLKLKGQGR